MKYFKLPVLVFICGLSIISLGQNNVGIGTNTPSPDAALDIQSTSQGVLVPRMTTVQRNAIASPTEGLLVYDTDVNCFFFYENSSSTWENLCTAGPAGAPGPAGPAGPQGVAGVAGPQGPSGVINKYHVYGTAGRLAVTSVTPTVQPGMVQTFTLTAPATVMIWATIGGRTTLTTSGAYATVDMVIYVNGNFLTNGGWNRFNVVNPTNSNSFNTCAINTMISLPAGTHTVDLRTFRGLSSTSPVDIGGDSANDTNPGEMTIMILN